MRSLPNSFAPLVMIPILTNAGFDSIFNAVQAEVARWNQPNNPQLASSATPTLLTLPKANTTRERGRQRRGRRNKSSSKLDRDDNNCCYCRLRGHYSRDCYKRKSEESNNDRNNSRNPSGKPPNRTTTGSNRSQYGTQNCQGRKLQFNCNSRFTTRGTVNGNINSHPQSYVVQRHDNAPASHEFYCNVAKYRSHIALLSQSKLDSAYIDSGATHHFSIRVSRSFGTNASK
eukprot:gb/GEZJ01001404.1/.p2 GENE.gb/GEZJ01001404.1/~~gb/GEZJ01001404.1/.p2  ORF type:complete len:230 (-),score=17.86 gb/GEZJ01001404.1/:2933-3622(-)